MSLTIANPSIVPPGGGFEVAHPQTGKSFKHVDINIICRNYRKYCQDNSLEAPNCQRITELMCDQHPDWCVDATTRMPTILQQAKNLIDDGVKWVKAGLPMTAQEVVAERLTICHACEFYHNGRCGKCACYMLAKTHVATGRCPIGRWESVSL